MSSAAERLEKRLKEELEIRIVPEGASGSFLSIIFPIVLQVITQYMQQCNATPERAAKRAKRMGFVTRSNLLTGFGRQPETNEIKFECLEATQVVVGEATVEDLVELTTEAKDDSMDWTPFGSTPSNEEEGDQ